eukprot:2938289-Amphidinium_carterae.1
MQHETVSAGCLPPPNDLTSMSGNTVLSVTSHSNVGVHMQVARLARVVEGSLPSDLQAPPPVHSDSHYLFLSKLVMSLDMQAMLCMYSMSPCLLGAKLGGPLSHKS